MNCPECRVHMPVIDSRRQTNYVRRRRECLDCGKRYTTREAIIKDTYHRPVSSSALKLRLNRIAGELRNIAENELDILLSVEPQDDQTDEDE